MECHEIYAAMERKLNDRQCGEFWNAETSAPLFHTGRNDWGLEGVFVRKMEGSGGDERLLASTHRNQANFFTLIVPRQSQGGRIKSRLPIDAKQIMVMPVTHRVSRFRWITADFLTNQPHL